MKWQLTVTQLNEYVRRTLASDPMLREITLQGEISGFKKQISGHWYFTLKDETSRVNCVLFRQNTYQVSFEPKDGDQVTLTGSVGLYTAAGSYQFYAEGMQRAGQGELWRRYELLKAKLAAEGLFDPARKRPLPYRPRRIAVVTSRSGAVIHDIKTVAGRRDPSVAIILRPALVQGEGAAKDIAEGIEEAARVAGADLLIVGRGGGSMEDLWAFNEEIVVRAIAACPIPVISAVGHEVDVTLSDFAADVRAATPSAAAEIAVPDREKLREQTAQMVLRLDAAAEGCLLQMGAALQAMRQRLTLCHPAVRIESMKSKCDLLLTAMNRQMENRLLLASAHLKRAADQLNALGPRQALERGYAFVISDGKPAQSLRELGEEALLFFSDGSARVRTIEKKAGDPFGSLQENAAKDV